MERESSTEMVFTAILKQRHSLVGKDALGIFLKFKEASASSVPKFARMSPDEHTEEMTEDQLVEAFTELTGRGATDFCQLAGREPNLANLRLLLHLTILEANEFGQQPGQQLQRESVPSEVQASGARPKPSKRLKTEASSAQGPQDKVKEVKEKNFGYYLKEVKEFFTSKDNSQLIGEDDDCHSIGDLYKTALSKEDNPMSRLVKKASGWEKGDPNPLPAIGRIIEELVGPYYNMYKKEEDKCEASRCCQTGNEETFPMGSSYEFFLWAVLFNEGYLALHFWMECAHRSLPPIVTALLASIILDKLSKKAKIRKDQGLEQELSNHSRLFEIRACDYVLNQCAKKSRKDTQSLLTREHKFLGEGATLLSVAYDGNRKRFLAHTACYVKLDEIWKGKMMWSTAWWKILLAAICPFLLLCSDFIHFSDDQEPWRGVCKNDVWGCPDNEVNSEVSVESNNASPKQVSTDQKNTEKCIQSCKEDDRDKCSVCMYFVLAPITKFYVYTIFYLVFLGLFSYVCLIDLHPGQPSVIETLVWIWILLFFIEEIRQMFTAGVRRECSRRSLKIWAMEKWNRFDLTLYLFSCVCFGVRFVPREHFHYSRNAFAVTLACYYFRFLQTYEVVRDIGPKVRTILLMLWDLSKFGLILLVFIICYGVASTTILYPNRQPTWDLFTYVFYSPYWQIFVRDAFVDTVDGANVDSCCSRNRSLWTGDTQVEQCPEENAFANLLLVIYIMFTHVLLLNLLIAMFTSTYEKFQRDSKQWWRFNRYSLVREYTQKPILPPPLIAICFLIWTVEYLLCRERSDDASPLCKKLKKNENIPLDSFEKENMETAMKMGNRMNEHKDLLAGYKRDLDRESIDQILATRFEERFDTLRSRFDKLELLIVSLRQDPCASKTRCRVCTHIPAEEILHEQTENSSS